MGTRWSCSLPDSREGLPGLKHARLRHLAFAVKDLEASVQSPAGNGVEVQPVRTDELTGKRFVFLIPVANHWNCGDMIVNIRESPVNQKNMAKSKEKKSTVIPIPGIGGQYRKHGSWIMPVM